MKFSSKLRLLLLGTVFFSLIIGLSQVSKSVIAQGGGASLFLSPGSGAFTVGSTFTVSVVLNTNSQFINAVQADISFSADKLQVVSPSLGTSVLSVWTNQPQFDNQGGFLRFQGGIPDPGINTSRGVISTITFRVKSVGRAVIKFLDTSKILLNDGLGTDILTNTTNGIYDLVLPPPAGPIVVSETHPDQSQWHKSPTISLRWTNNYPVEGYSYVLNSEPIDVPDNILEGPKTDVLYKNIADGVHFFHIKALRDGVWGETSHFAIKIDATPPANFPIEISPSARTSERRPLINFFTTDALS
ncbi:MAG: cohesin domain-containing protein, partial [Patescibacteria group bacterium]